jgi:hypothetical protein
MCSVRLPSASRPCAGEATEATPRPGTEAARPVVGYGPIRVPGNGAVLGWPMGLDWGTGACALRASASDWTASCSGPVSAACEDKCAAASPPLADIVVVARFILCRFAGGLAAELG